MPKVSIIIPVYNVEKYLRTCLDSILAQTFTDFEAILVDDGSTDDSGKICDEYAAKKNCFVVVHKPNEGVSKARITAFEHCKGEYITFIDADDYVDKQYIAHLYGCIVKYNADVSCCQYYRVDERGARLSVRTNFGLFDKSSIENVLIPSFGWDRKLGKEAIPPFLWTKMIKRDYVKDILESGKGLWYGEDQCGVLHMLYMVNSIFNSEKPFYYYVFHEGQATATMNRKRWDAYESFWGRMINEDIKGLWAKNAPYKILEHLKRYLNSWYYNAKDYKTFKEEALYALNSDILERCLFHAEIEELSKKERIDYILIKNKFTFLYYYIRKIRGLIR